jgi:hypothetical protein
MLTDVVTLLGKVLLEPEIRLLTNALVTHFTWHFFLCWPSVLLFLAFRPDSPTYSVHSATKTTYICARNEYVIPTLWLPSHMTRLPISMS